MITREEWIERKKQWELFNRWKAEQPPLERDPARIVADLGTLLSWLPAEVRAEDPDPEKRGIQRFRKALERLNLRL